MELLGEIKGISYNTCLSKVLKRVSYVGFDINNISSSIIIEDGANTYALSRWTGPKRTRTYPYAKVYDTLNDSSKIITVIPVLKDEGVDGDNDYLQFDTISLMSLLNVYVILVPFISAEKNISYNNKITKFKIDNKYVKNKIDEIKKFKSPAIHYNSNMCDTELIPLIIKAKAKYKSIAKKTGVKLHDITLIDKFLKRISYEKDAFKFFSRDKAKNAQTREINTVQPNESLTYDDKASITIDNHLGGKYYFTIDEIYFNKNKTLVYLRESKHSENHNFPSISDIKDGLLKMIVYTNLNKVIMNGLEMKFIPVLRLTSSKLRGSLSSNSVDNTVNKFIKLNNLSKAKTKLVRCLVQEARGNNFEVIIEKN